MNSKHLLVPAHLDAMVLNKEASTATPFLRFQMDYEQLKSFNNPEPEPFGGASTKQPGAGIYLHWTLPQALRHGVFTEDGNTDFPLVPNRWIVVRTQSGTKPSKAVKAWILMSDYLGDDGTNPFVNPYSLGSNDTIQTTRIGKVFRFPQDANGLTAQGKSFLTAAGPGSVTFTVFSPGIENVFSFYDDVTGLDDADEISKAVFTYTVLGWYSDPDQDDPLKNTTWTENSDPDYEGSFINSGFNWVVYSDSGALPDQMIVHAMTPGVVWDKSAENPPADNYPANIQKNVKVAVGNNAIDALAAIVSLENASTVEADLLEAFNYNLLDHFDDSGSSEALNASIRDHWFGASPGGILWQILRAKRQDNSALPLPKQPKITAEQAKALAALNTAQSELDQQQRILESMQTRLFDLWWKTNWQKYNLVPVSSAFSDWLETQLPLQIGDGVTCNNTTGIDPDKESWYACKVKAQMNLVSQLTDAVNSAVEQVKKLLDEKQELKSSTKPQFNYPNDPVLLVTGLGRSTNYDPDEYLICRLTSQNISSLTIHKTTYGIDDTCTKNIMGDIPVLDDPNHVLPEGSRELHIENFFLSPIMFAQNILGDAAQSDTVRKAYDSLSKPAADIQFEPVSIAMAEWVQPWVPLLLDWQITVLKEPAYSCPEGGDTATFNRENWTFDGTDFQWTGPTVSTGKNFDESDSGQMQISGRTFITPQVNMTLAKQLDLYLKKHQMRDPNLQALLKDLDTCLDSLAGQDILSQRLSGMTGMMVERTLTQHVTPTGDIAGILGDCNNGYPNPFPDQHAGYADAVWGFAPMRGSFFVINKLSVIDNFGRTVDLMLGNYSTYPGTQEEQPEYYFYPYAARNLKSPTAKDPAPGQKKSSNPAERMMQLPPRSIQDSRLGFDLIWADETSKDTNPVCGWIVPNHLDRSLAVYDANGTAWGELFLSRHASGYAPVWITAPNHSGADQTINVITDLHVRTMLQKFFDRKDNGAGLNEFMQAIDETLWTVNPRGWRNDQNLSVLIGRPLAIVRAQLSLQFKGAPAMNQDWWNTFDVDMSNLPDPSQPATLKDVDGGVFDYLWQVRLGSSVLSNDGLVGYYLDNSDTTYDVFNTVVMPESAQTGYLKKIGADNYLNLRFIDDTITTPDPAKHQICRITMLVDPRASIHAFSGLLPVKSIDIPASLVSRAFDNIAYSFRAGPFLTSPDAVRIPKPIEQKGTWSWFDKVLDDTTSFTQTDDKVRFSSTPPLVKEGWLGFQPYPEKG